MQVFSSRVEWTFPTGTLGDLTREAHLRADSSSVYLAGLRDVVRDLPPVVPFASALRGETIRVIAEVKRASPTKGTIRSGINAAEQAMRYVEGGAAAISVLTEPTRFGGSLVDLQQVAVAVSVPVIRKDFLVHPSQMWEARTRGAAAALLIVRALSPDELARLMDEALACGIATLVEVRDEWELERALGVHANVIGVNNRNLETLVIDPLTAPRLIPQIPSACVAVAESGMQSASDIAPAAQAGADAILVGSFVSASDDPAASVAALCTTPRSLMARKTT